MSKLLTYGIIASFIGMLFINIFFRVRVFKSYKYLVQNKVDFKVSDLLNEKRLKEEVIPSYPAHEKEILSFSRNIKYSVLMAIGLIALILLFGFFLLKEEA